MITLPLFKSEKKSFKCLGTASFQETYLVCVDQHSLMCDFNGDELNTNISLKKEILIAKCSNGYLIC